VASVSTVQLNYLSKIFWGGEGLLLGGVSPQLILGCRWYALLLARSVDTQLALREASGGVL
jgi:hypothetical protein